MGACDGARRGLRQGGARVGRVMPRMEKSPAACVSRPSATEQTLWNGRRIDMTKRKKQAVAYVRVRSTNQEEGLSVEMQAAACIEVARLLAKSKEE